MPIIVFPARQRAYDYRRDAVARELSRAPYFEPEMRRQGADGSGAGEREASRMEITPQGAQLREAYVPNRRMRLASDVACLCAALLLVGLLGTAFTWWGRSALFDLAANSRETVKIDPGFLVGPALILIALPLVFGRSRQLALKRLFRARLLIAALLWVAGLGVLFVKVSGLDSSYTIEAGTYVSAGLLLVGLLSTLAMWPGDLPVVQVNRKGMPREPTAAAAPR